MKLRAVIVAALLLTINVVLLLFWEFAPRNVEITFIQRIQVNEPLDQTYIVIRSKADLTKVLSWYDVRSFGSISKEMNYDRYDYVVSPGKPIKRMWYRNCCPADECDFIKNLIPLNVEYEISSPSYFIYLYQLSDKGKYRHMCD